MPPTQRGQAYKLAPGKWGLRYDQAGARRRENPFPSKSAALAHFREVIEPQATWGGAGRAGGSPLPRLSRSTSNATRLAFEPDDPRAAMAARHRHQSVRRCPVRELERMAGELADLARHLPEGPV